MALGKLVLNKPQFLKATEVFLHFLKAAAAVFFASSSLMLFF